MNDGLPTTLIGLLGEWLEERGFRRNQLDLVCAPDLHDAFGTDEIAGIRIKRRYVEGEAGTPGRGSR